MKLKKIILTFLFLLIILISFFYLKPKIEQSRYIDFKVNYIAGNIFFKMPDKLYGYDFEKKINVPFNGSFTYQPFVALLFSPFYYLVKDFTTSKKIWFFINYISLCLILYFVKKYFYKNFDFIFLLITVFILFYKPLIDNLRYGNIKLILLFLYVLFFICILEKKEFSASFLLSLLIALSIQPIILTLYFLLKNKIKIFIITYIFFIVSVFIPCFFVGYQPVLKYYTVVIPNLFFEGASAMPYIQSIDAFFKRLFLPDNEATVNIISSTFLAIYGSLLTKLFLFIFTFYVLYKYKKVDDKYFLQFNLLFIFTVLIHSINWEYHYTILIFSFLLFIRYFVEVKNIDFFVIILFIIIALKIPYDHKIFTQNKFLLMFTNIKILALLFLYFRTIRLIYKK
ncbi:MAG TPA: glycosyltransferase family 87 protein [bacterium]|mgnify:CR=1 FL=1|nr:glycosyltransferase family 87 protein [bacterium]HOL47710.1 glycosyltransferase family 87 protein [bacterium]HPQ19068.1 glycosyltransferase family 87 protein [bacterium]